ncbi:MAG: methyltransferase domain-containing protein [Bacteroidota bacterium]|nr:methyltransferase domain-containing protein [Bacteroidota bacterium]
MPGHWLLARMGKRVLRPGGRELTMKIIDALDINADDSVVEFAPGIGSTAQLIFARKPQHYTGIDQNEEAVNHLASLTNNHRYNFINKNITNSGLPGLCASVVLGEAVLTMQTEERKEQIISEACRLLQRGGRYAIHEIALRPDDIQNGMKNEIQQKLSEKIHVNARPLTTHEWTLMLNKCGFRIIKILTNPMHLLKLSRMIRDEGFMRAAGIAFRIATTPHAFKRVKGMRNVFDTYEHYMTAISIIAIKE